MNQNVKTLRDYALNDMHGGDLRGYSAREAARVLLNNWEDAIGDGSSHNLVDDVNLVIEHLQKFRDEAAKHLPVVNGGLAGVSLADWRVRLAAQDVEIYPCPQHRISRFGYTDCEAADYQSEDEAITAAVAHYFG